MSHRSERIPDRSCLIFDRSSSMLHRSLLVSDWSLPHLGRPTVDFAYHAWNTRSARRPIPEVLCFFAGLVVFSVELSSLCSSLMQTNCGSIPALAAVTWIVACKMST